MQTWWRGVSELDGDQKAIMDLPRDGSFAVTGPPGSGKTNLLLMRAAYLSTLSRNIAVVVMNRTLAEFIRTGAAGYGVPPEAVMTSRQFIGSLAREAGHPLPKGQSWEEGRADALAALRQIRAATQGPIYDAILIDEAQDHNEEELQALRALTHDIFLTADARQLIYSNGSRDDRFASIVSEHRTLRYHYRSAPDICDLADDIGSTFSAGYTRIGPTCRYPADSPDPEIRIKTGTIAEQGAMIADRLDAQLRAYRGELIGVFAPNRNDASQIAEILTSRGYGKMMTVQVGADGYLEMDPERPICVSTVHGAKGLEFRSVHFASAETVVSHGASRKRLAFTGVTRAKSSLTIYHNSPLPTFFNAAVARWRDDPTPQAGWQGIFK